MLFLKSALLMKCMPHFTFLYVHDILHRHQICVCVCVYVLPSLHRSIDHHPNELKVHWEEM